MRTPAIPATNEPDRYIRRRTWHRRLAAVVAGVAAAVVLVPLHDAAGSRPAPDPARNPAVIGQWNAVAMDVLTPSDQPLLTQPFVVATMHVAMYDAVVAIEGQYTPFGTLLTASPSASSAAAAATAAHAVLVTYLPDDAAAFDAALDESLAAIPDGSGQTAGVVVGRAAAHGTLADRLGSGSHGGPTPSSREPGPGVWAPAPPATSGHTPWLAHAQPFTMRSPDQFRPSSPPALDSVRYRRDLDEVRRLGGTASAERTAEQTTIAEFWGDQPIAQNQRALRGHADKLGWDIASTARLFAAALTSQADAIIACWDTKYHYQLWRPSQSIPTVEPGWTPLLSTPNHPEFPSAHGCVTGSLGYTLARVMGTDEIDLDIDAANVGVTRHFTTRQDLLTEVGDARIWAGLHYRFSVDTGLRLAQQVVNLNLSQNFRPAR